MTNRESWIRKHLLAVDGADPSARIRKHLKMAESSFVFYRGSAQLFYADLAAGTITLPPELLQLPKTAIMGDCHLSNFGFFTEEGSHGDSVIFAPNDFDDACMGHPVWDLLRFSISLELAAKHGEQAAYEMVQSEANDSQVTPKIWVSHEQVERAIDAFLNEYLESCRQSAASAAFVYTAVKDFEKPHILFKPYAKALKRAARGELFESKSSLAKACEVESKQLKFKSLPDRFETLSPEQYQEVLEQFAPYVDDTILDIVIRKGAGTGSVNMPRYYLLVGPTDYKGKQDLPLAHIVEVKQQRIAAPLFHFTQLSPINRLNPAHLTVTCQRRMQRSPDLVLDEVEWRETHWLVRSRHHAKVGVDPEDITLGNKAAKKDGFIDYAICCGRALALAHCRGDRRSKRFEQAVVNTLPVFINQIKETALVYAKQVDEDAQILKQLVQ